jgi:hypothetical protein
LISQSWGVRTTLVWSDVGSAILYKVVDVIVGLRANVETERESLDIPSTPSAPTICEFSRGAISQGRAHNSGSGTYPAMPRPLRGSSAS